MDTRSESRRQHGANRQKARFDSENGVLAILRFVLGAGVTPAEGGVEPSAGSTLNEVTYADCACERGRIDSARSAANSRESSTGKVDTVTRIPGALFIR